ncbi:glycoside hydrolase family 3 N-terminal domain-containing protein [Hasllibacter sp. MH4015]|uniref:glycoside hydrolase family 3 N-terminal domain-containing protein n=1 Tax=Hasllibacter sp. MH4015 TaxID=2854029 RepID=UPI001CD36F2C|nr:glycoside hydrolase family 3 N-terminal domain-containing protein [Hasllibacter sp. MH4015]
MGAATILGCAGLRLSRDERDFFKDAAPWGFILFARNVEDAGQVSALTSELRDSVGFDAPILIDQEGGRVQRLRGPIWREWHPPLDQMARGGAEAMRLRYRLIAHELRAIGIDVNCAPQADVARADTHPFLRNRCYGEDAATVTEAALAVADGLMEGGVLPVVKHIPGHGAGIVDSHHDLPHVTQDRATLEQVDFAPFRALSHLPLGMTAHILYDALGHTWPATMDAEMISLIRDEIGFQGALMTDDLSMNALPGTIGERAARAKAAGVDLVLHCNGELAEMEDVVTESGPLDGPSESRADAALAWRKAPDPLDIPATEAALSGLLDGEVYV